MPTRFFKKFGPNNPPVYNSRKIPFPSNDGLIGYRATDDAGEAAFYLQCLREQRYGLTEITAADYQSEYLEKKTAAGTRRGTIWSREELSASSYRRGGLSVIGADAVRAATALSTASDIPADHVPAVLPFGAQERGVEVADEPPNLAKRKTSV
jgi:hypothetical protein